MQKAVWSCLEVVRSTAACAYLKSWSPKKTLTGKSNLTVKSLSSRVQDSLGILLNLLLAALKIV